MSVWPPCCDVLQHVGCCWLNRITHDIATLLAQNLQAPAKRLQHFDRLNISQLCWAQHVACVWPICCDQEIIKVREWIPHIGPLTKVIRLKIFLDIVPSSSEDITRAMRGQPKRLSRNYLRKNGGNVISYVLVSFHTGDVFCTLSRLFVQSGVSFVFLLVWLFIILPFIRF